MADDLEERRANTLALSRQTASFVAALAASVLIGIGTVFYQRGLVLIALEEKLAHLDDEVVFLKRYGPGTGSRYTQEDHKRYAAEVDEDVDEVKTMIRDLNQEHLFRHQRVVKELEHLRESHAAHTQTGAHVDAARRLHYLERTLGEPLP